MIKNNTRKRDKQTRKKAQDMPAQVEKQNKNRERLRFPCEFHHVDISLKILTESAFPDIPIGFKLRGELERNTLNQFIFRESFSR